jgi:hypothetical protein
MLLLPERIPLTVRVSGNHCIRRYEDGKKEKKERYKNREGKRKEVACTKESSMDFHVWNQNPAIKQ